MKIYSLLLTLISSGFLLLFAVSCYYDNEDYLYPETQGPAGCDTTNVTYTNVVVPILATHCNNCHNPADASYGVIVASYDELIKVVENGSFWGSINHSTSYYPMPKGGGKLRECDLLRIKKWIDDGALNN